MYLRLGELPVVVASSPDAAREMLKTHDAIFSTRATSVTLRECIGDRVGISFLPYGKQWRHLRGICTVELLSPKRVRSLCPIREEQVARLVDGIAAAATCPSGGEPVNVSRHITVTITDLALRAVMGDCFLWREQFLETLDKATKNLTGFSIADLFPSSRLLSSIGSTVRDMKVLNAKIFELVDRAIEQHREKKAADEDSDTLGDRECLLNIFLRIQKEDDDHAGTLTMATVKAVIVDMFGAGSDTTSKALEWAMSELVKNPEVMQKAQAEIRHALQGKSRVTEGDLINLKYPKNIIKETLRLHPVIPLVPRECQESCEILGYDVPKGTTMLANLCAIGRDPRYWNDAEVFMPERFEKTNIDFRGTNFEFILFGAGRRMCPGIKFAHATMELALTALLYHFNWHLPPSVKLDKMDMEEEFSITLCKTKNRCLHPILHVGLEVI